jgi:hypothetical protein
MQEFSSISVSSYEAGALADQLTEQSRAGWSVVAIVPTGSAVTAYLSRSADGAADSDAPVVAATPTPFEATETGGDAVPADEPSEAAADPGAEASGWAAGSSEAADTADTTPADTDHFTVADEPAAEPAPAMSATDTAGAAPAGWYADPSSRFELRYWDGGQWTEHVSRAGQQYTDPPVA